MNAIKWAGGKISYRDVDLFTGLDWIKGKNYKGVHSRHIKSILQLFGLNANRKKNPTFNDMRKALDQGNSLILLFTFWKKDAKEPARHYIFIDRHTDKYFMGYNIWQTGSKYFYKPTLAKDFRAHGRWRNWNEMWEIKL